MNRALYAALAVGAVVIALTAWVAYPPPAKSAVAADPTTLRFMHCSKCWHETVYSPTAYDRPCVRCGHSLVATAESVKITGGGRNRFRRMVSLIFVELVCLLGAVVAILYFPKSDGEVEYFYTYCPKAKCKRKIRYAAHKAGLIAACPLCRTEFVFPELEEQEH